MVKHIFGLICALWLAVTVSLPVQAQDQSEEFTAEHLSVAREAMLATRSTAFFDNILPTMAEEVRNTFIRMDPSLTTVIEEKTLEAALELAERRQQLDDRFIREWAQNFDQEELTEIRDFLTSATGEKFVNLSAEITQVQTTMASEWTSELSADFVALVRSKLADAGYRL